MPTLKNRKHRNNKQIASMKLIGYLCKCCAHKFQCWKNYHALQIALSFSRMCMEHAFSYVLAIVWNSKNAAEKS